MTPFDMFPPTLVSRAFLFVVTRSLRRTLAFGGWWYWSSHEEAIAVA
jgi:hypothetical protein